jgi:anti-sigma regulatory factor (Ser/Thr protein kinase)
MSELINNSVLHGGPWTRADIAVEASVTPAVVWVRVTDPRRPGRDSNPRPNG